VVAVARRFVLVASCVAAVFGVGLAQAAPAGAAAPVAALRICTDCAASGGDLSRYEYVILNAWDAGKIPTLKAKNPTLKALLYQDAAATYEFACHGGVDDALLPAGVGYCEASTQHPSWFLKDTAGARVQFCDYPGSWQMDVGSAAYADAWSARVAATLKAGLWDGVMIDDINSTERYHLCGKALAAYPTDAAYEAATRSFLARVSAKIMAQGSLVLPNINYDCWEACWSNFIQYTSGGVREWWTKNTKGYAGQYGDNGWDWANSFLRLTQQAGKIFIGITYAPRDDVRSMRYARASFLLDWNGGPSALSFEPAQEATDPWNDEWTADLGAPTGRRYQAAGVSRRDFAGGTVVVNASSGTSANVPLGGTYVAPDGSLVTSVTLAPMTAAILRSAERAQAPPAPVGDPGQSSLLLSASMDRSGDVTLAWQGANGPTVEIYRNGKRIGVVDNTGSSSDRVRPKGGPYTYVVCEAAGACSPPVTVPSPARKLSAHRRSVRRHAKHQVHRAYSRWRLVRHS
jgi:hypothetical protein